MINSLTQQESFLMKQKRAIRDNGATIIEYTLMATVIVIVCVVAIMNIGFLFAGQSAVEYCSLRCSNGSSDASISGAQDCAPKFNWLLQGNGGCAADDTKCAAEGLLFRVNLWCD